MVVGVAQAPPMAMKGPDGKWNGLTIDVWIRTAEALKLPYQIQEFAIADLNAPELWEKKGIDIVPGYVDSKWSEERVDVTAPYLTSGLAIATRTEPTSGFTSILRKMSSL